MNSFKRQKIFLHDEMRKCLRAIEKEDCSPKYLQISECPIKGRGIKTCEDIQEGSFITYYKGKFTNKPPNDHTYMFVLPAHNGNTPLFIDASKEDGSYARLLNDNHQNPNIRVKCITVNGLPYPCFFALRDIAKGEDLEFDYSSNDEQYPWRTSNISTKERTASFSSSVSSHREHCPLETRLKELEDKVNKICDVENKVQKILRVQKKLRRDSASILKAVVTNQMKIACNRQSLQRILKRYTKVSKAEHDYQSVTDQFPAVSTLGSDAIVSPTELSVPPSQEYSADVSPSGSSQYPVSSPQTEPQLHQKTDPLSQQPSQNCEDDFDERCPSVGNAEDYESPVQQTDASVSTNSTKLSFLPPLEDSGSSGQKDGMELPEDEIGTSYNQNNVDGLPFLGSNNDELKTMFSGKIGISRKIDLIISEILASPGDIKVSTKPTDVHIDENLVQSKERHDITEKENEREGGIKRGPSVIGPISSHSSDSTLKKMDSDDTLSIPKYSIIIKKLLEKGEIIKEWDKFIEETAFHAIAENKLYSRESYAVFGKMMFKQYPCIRAEGINPWAFFNKRLSQKLRNLRWRQKKHVLKAGSILGTNKICLLTSSSTINVGGGSGKSESEPYESMVSQMKTVGVLEEKDWDIPNLSRLQKKSFIERRKWIRSLENADVSSIVSEFPILQYRRFIENEFYMICPAVNAGQIEANWRDILRRLHATFNIDTKKVIPVADIEDPPTAKDEISLLKVIQNRLKSWPLRKKFQNLITFEKASEFERKAKAEEPPRLVVLLSDSGFPENGFILADGIIIDCKTPIIRELICILVMSYYVYDLSYPIQYKCLGFFQTYLLKEKSKFFKSSKYIKFIKGYTDMTN